MPRMIDLQKTIYIWVPGDTGIANVAAPKATEIIAGKDISKYCVQTTKVMAAASDTTKERSVIDGANAEAPTVGNYAGQLDLFRSGDNIAGTFASDDPFTIFTSVGLVGWIAKRTGLPFSTLPAASQVGWEIYKFITDVPTPSGGAQDGYLKLTVPLHPQGQFNVNATLT